MVEYNQEFLDLWNEMRKTRQKMNRNRIYLIRSFYTAAALLVFTFWWILFPPVQELWSRISNFAYLMLMANFLCAIWLVRKIKLIREYLSTLRIILKQKVWGKICNCQQPCDCSARMEKELSQEYGSWEGNLGARGETWD